MLDKIIKVYVDTYLASNKIKGLSKEKIIENIYKKCRQYDKKSYEKLLDVLKNKKSFK